MFLQKFVCAPIENNTYVLVCEDNKKAIVIDPSFGACDKIIKFLKDKEVVLDKILLTHSHWDHIADVKNLKTNFPSAVVCVHKLDAKNLENPESRPEISIEGIKPDILLENDQIIKLGNLEILTLHTPGHTPGGVCFYIEKEKILFSGDTLFKGSFGRVDFPTSNPEDMIQSLKKLSELPKDIKVYPGHGNSTTIEKENWIKNVEKFI